jgi:hypothetical protein
MDLAKTERGEFPGGKRTGRLHLYSDVGTVNCNVKEVVKLLGKTAAIRIITEPSERARISNGEGVLDTGLDVIDSVPSQAGKFHGPEITSENGPHISTDQERMYLSPPR